MSDKLNDKDLALIMAYVDGELDSSQKPAVEKLIAENTEAKKALGNFKLSSTVYKDYVSNIQSDSKSATVKYETYFKKEKLGFLEAIFQKPMRNFIAYPIAAVFIFTLGFQMNNFLEKSVTQDTEQFRGIEKQDEISEKIAALESELADLKEQIESYKKEIEGLTKRLQEKN